MNVHKRIEAPPPEPVRAPDDLLVADLADLLHNPLKRERFWTALAGHPHALLARRAISAAPMDSAALAWKGDEIARIEAWRASHGRTALYAECDEATALAMALHLGCFDLVLATGSSARLSDADKAEWIARHSGHASPAMLEPLARRANFRDYARALRPHQWLKNALVLVPLLAGHQFETAVLLDALLAFLAFCAVASGVYVINDLLDLGPDRAHPRKRLRPFASGAVPLSHGVAMAVLLLAAGAGLAALLNPGFVAALASYFLLTTAYSFKLKRIAVIDIGVLGLLYTLRIVAGGLAAGIVLSVWLLAFSLFFFFSLAAVKRQAELVDNANRSEIAPSGRGYRVEDLPIISMVAVGASYVSVLVMALYVNSPDVLKLYPHPAFLWGICCVLLFWVTRTVLLAHRGQMHDDPVVYAARDVTSLACGATALACAILGALP